MNESGNGQWQWSVAVVSPSTNLQPHPYLNYFSAFLLFYFSVFLIYFSTFYFSTFLLFYFSNLLFYFSTFLLFYFSMFLNYFSTFLLFYYNQCHARSKAINGSRSSIIMMLDLSVVEPMLENER